MDTVTTAANAAKDTTAHTAPAKPDKPQRRMARPAPNDAGAATATAAQSPTAQRAPAPATGSKTNAVIALLERGEGATLAELIAATGWLPHTTRAALTGLRKKGHSIERNKRDDVTCYRIVKPA